MMAYTLCAWRLSRLFLRKLWPRVPSCSRLAGGEHHNQRAYASAKARKTLNTAANRVVANLLDLNAKQYSQGFINRRQEFSSRVPSRQTHHEDASPWPSSNASGSVKQTHLGADGLLNGSPLFQDNLPFPVLSDKYAHESILPTECVSVVGTFCRCSVGHNSNVSVTLNGDTI